MQKALAQMNIQIVNVIADIVGETGQMIVRAIIAGERDPYKLASLRNYRVKASEEEIAKSLQGNWRQEHLFALKQAVVLFDAYSEQLRQCDCQLQKMLQELKRYDGEHIYSKARSRKKNESSLICGHIW